MLSLDALPSTTAAGPGARSAAVPAPDVTSSGNRASGAGFPIVDPTLLFGDETYGCGIWGCPYPRMSRGIFRLRWCRLHVESWRNGWRP